MTPSPPTLRGIDSSSPHTLQPAVRLPGYLGGGWAAPPSASPMCRLHPCNGEAPECRLVVVIYTSAPLERTVRNGLTGWGAGDMLPCTQVSVMGPG